MSKKKWFFAGLAALLVVGLVYASGFGGLGKRGLGRPNMDGVIDDLGLDEDATPMEVMEAVRENRIAELGLSEDATSEEMAEAMFEENLDELGLSWDSTVRELFDARKEQRQLMMQERLTNMGERLGLPEDATEDEIKEALKDKMGAGLGGRHMGTLRGHMMGGFPGF